MLRLFSNSKFEIQKTQANTHFKIFSFILCQYFQIFKLIIVKCLAKILNNFASDFAFPVGSQYWPPSNKDWTPERLKTRNLKINELFCRLKKLSNQNIGFVYIWPWRISIWHNFPQESIVYTRFPVATFVASSLWRGRGPSWLWYTESRFCCVASCVKKIGLADKFAIFFVTWPLSIKLQDWNVSLDSDFSISCTNFSVLVSFRNVEDFFFSWATIFIFYYCRDGFWFSFLILMFHLFLAWFWRFYTVLFQNDCAQNETLSDF